ncbi:TonB-dependent receptor, partial [Acidithiobacillus ferrooxidans]|nr:TonB-dependent receptor [Acidithiobacillus ferrooxidans]
MPSKPSNPPVTVTHADHRVPKVSRLLFTAILFALYPALDAVAYASTANNSDVSKSTPTEKVVKLREIKKKYEKILVGERNIASAMS